MKVMMMEMMIQLVLSVNRYGDYAKGERMRCSLFVTYVMAMSALNALQKALIKTMIFIALIVLQGIFERVSDNIFVGLSVFLVLFEE